MLSLNFLRPLTRTRTVIVAVAIAILLAGTALVSSSLAADRHAAIVTTAEPTTEAAVAPTPAAPPAPAAPADPVPPDGVLNTDADVSVDTEGFFAWAARDRTTGVTVGSDNAETDTSSAESMIKAWLVADYLRQAADDGQEPSRALLTDASLAIRDSHNGAAERLYVANGRDDSVQRMIDICGLTATHTPAGDEGWWSRTEISALDAVRLGECLVDGRAAGPEWTDWLLGEMRQVRGSTDPADQRTAEDFEGGRWGIIDGVPATQADSVAMKNGWTRIGRTDSWHLGCLAVTDQWVISVLMRYPAEYPLAYGAERCAAVAEQLTSWPTEPAPNPM